MQIIMLMPILIVVDMNKLKFDNAPTWGKNHFTCHPLFNFYVILSNILSIT